MEQKEFALKCEMEFIIHGFACIQPDYLENSIEYLKVANTIVNEYETFLKLLETDFKEAEKLKDLIHQQIYEFKINNGVEDHETLEDELKADAQDDEL